MGRSAGVDSGRSVFGGPPPVGGSRDSCGSGPEVWLSSGSGGRGGTCRRGSGEGLQGVGAEFAQRVETAPGELAGDRQRRLGVREPARLERQVVGAVGAVHADVEAAQRTALREADKRATSPSSQRIVVAVNSPMP